MKKKLVQFLFSKKGVNVLDELKNRVEVDTRTEVIRIAISLLWWATEHTKNGGKIAVIRDGNVGEADIAPFWELSSLNQINLEDSIAKAAESGPGATKSAEYVEQLAKVS